MSDPGKLGVLHYGEPASRLVSARHGGAVATTTALTAITPEFRAADQLWHVTADDSIWRFDSTSSATASPEVLVPDSGSGRFLLVLGVRKRTVTITAAADLAGLGAGVKNVSINIGVALPANARILGHSIGEGTFTGFQDAGDTGTFGLELGGAAAADLAASVNVRVGQSGFPKAGTVGALGFPMAPQSAQQLKAKLTSSVDLNTASAGAVTVNVFFVVRS